jgi:hypothetical protein
MAKLKKILKKAGKAAALAGAAYGASKMMDAKKAGIRDAAKVAYVGGASSRDKAMGSRGKTGAAKKSIIDKVKSFFPGPDKNSSYADVLGGMDNTFGLGPMDGAKAGKMIKARGGKMVNLKPTKLY